MTGWLHDVHDEIARQRAEGSLDPEWEQRALAVVSLIGTSLYVHFDPEGFVRPADYVEVIEALAEAGGAKLALGAFDVTADAEAITFRGSVAGSPVTFTLPPFTTDWFDADLLFHLNRAVAAAGPRYRIVDVDVQDGPYLFIMTERDERALKRHPLQLIWTDEEVPPSEPPAGECPEERATAGEATGMPMEPAFQPTRLQVPAPLAREALAVVGLARHPTNEHFVMRLAAADGSPRAVLVDQNGRGWFAPEGCVDMVWAPDGATTYVVFAQRVEAWVWGEDVIRARHDAPGHRLHRAVASQCGRHLAVIATDGAANRLLVLDAATLERRAELFVGRTLGVGFTDDGATVVCFRLDPLDPAEGRQTGGFDYCHLATGEHGAFAWYGERGAAAEPDPPAHTLLPLRVEGSEWIVRFPSGFEARLDPLE